MSLMRPSLIPGLLGNLSHNLRRGEKEVRLYELASTFQGVNPKGKAPAPKSDKGPAGEDSWALEQPTVAGLLSGSRSVLSFDKPLEEVDYYDLKGVVSTFLSSARMRGASVVFEPAHDQVPFLHPKSATFVYLENEGTKTLCGVLGETHPALMELLNISEKAFVFEIDLAILANRVNQVVKAVGLPKFPSVKRDFALLMDDSVPAGEIVDAIKGHEGLENLLEDVEIFDVYRGSNLPEHKKSIAVSLVLRAADRTLTDVEVQNGTELLLKTLSERLGAEIR